MRKMTANTVVKLSLAVVATMILMGCSKKSSEEAPAPQAATETKPTVAPVPTPAPVAADASLAGAVTPTPSVSGAEPTPSPAPQETAEQKAEALRQIATYEGVYRSSTDFSSRIDAIYRISDVGTAESVASLGRLFGFEKDPELKTEILDALADVDGQDDQKVAILTAAVSPDQAKDVRQSAIDALTNIEAQKSLPILQNLVNDSDSDISESAKDAIEQVKANMESSP